MRTFLAVEVPADVKRALASLQEELRSSGADVRWIRPEGIHLTLKFLGEIPSQRVDEIREAVEEMLGTHRPFSLEVRGLGGFPRLSQPRVVWVGLGGEVDRLRALQEDVEKGMNALGFPREERPFHPHLTLGRVRSPRRRDRLLEGIRSLMDIQLGGFRVEAVAQFESELLPSGARYTRLWEHPLGDEDHRGV
jgi:2'-5' RNA ligase